MTVFTKLKCWGSGEISKSWNSWMESAEIVCVRGKLVDLLTCSKNFCVNKRQLLPISRFSAKLQYILPLRSYNMRLKLQGDVSHWNFDVSFWGSEGLPNPQSRKRGRVGGEGRVHHVPLIFLFFQTLLNENSCSSLACHFCAYLSTTHGDVMKKISWLEICCQMSHVLSFCEVQQTIFYIIRCSLWTWHNHAK